MQTNEELEVIQMLKDEWPDMMDEACKEFDANPSYDALCKIAYLELLGRGLANA